MSSKRVPGIVTSNASTTTQALVEALFLSPVASIVNVWLESASPVALKISSTILCVGEYVSTSPAKPPSRTHTTADPAEANFGTWTVLLSEHGHYKIEFLSAGDRIDAHRFYEALGFERSAEGFRKYL